MRRARPPALAAVAAAAAVAAGLLVGAAVLALDDGEPERGDRGPSVGVSASLSPPVHEFGDPVAATIDVVLDNRRIDPDVVRVRRPFRPYELVAPPVVERTDAGPTTRLRYRYTIACYQPDCLPDDEPTREIQLPTGEVTYRHADVRGRSREIVLWPALHVQSRLEPVPFGQQQRLRVDPFRPVGVSYRIAPGLLAAGLAAGAALLLLLGGVLALRSLPRQARPPEGEAPPVELSPLQRALELAEHASRNGAGTDEQRKALERLARELVDIGEGVLAEQARRLAWSPARPSTGDVGELAAAVRRAHGERA